MPESMNERRTGIPDSVNAMRQVGAIKPNVDPGLEAARNFLQPTAINKDIIAMSASQLERAKDEFQPMAKKEMPDIRMQLSGRDDEEDARNEYERRQRAARGATPGMEQFQNKLARAVARPQVIERLNEEIEKTYEEIDKIESKWEAQSQTGGVPTDKEYWRWEGLKRRIGKNEARLAEIQAIPETEVAESYNQMMEQQISAVESIFRISIDQKKNAYPYDHRTAEYTIQSLFETLESLHGQEWTKTPEAEVWLKKMESDAFWLADVLQVLVAESASAPYYFDVVMQLQILKERYKAIVKSEHLQGINAKEIEGLEFNAAEKTMIKDRNVGLAIPNEYKRAEVNLTNGEVLSLRELGVKMRDESFAIRMKMAAVSQVDFEATNPEKTTFMGDHLKKEEVEFYKQLLWVYKVRSGATTGEGVLEAPHMVSKDHEKRRVSAKLEAMLVTNAAERLQKIIDGDLGGYATKNEAITALADAVKAESETRLKRWKKRGKDVVSRLAILTTKQGLYEDFALLHVYRYCWQFKWNTDALGNPTTKNGTDQAGIYSWSGDAYSLWFLKRAMGYDRMGNARTQFLWPSSKGGRAEIANLPYDQMPKFDPNEVMQDAENNPDAVDTFLQEQWGLLFGTDTASVAARKELGYGDIPPQIQAKLKDWAVKWRTPFSSKYSDEDGTNYELVIPHFMPGGLDVANFYEAITEGETKLNKGGKSVWQELIEGKKLSEINWTTQEDFPMDRWHVDLDMASRYMKIYIEVFEKEKDPFFALVTGTPATLGPKEMAKRLRLTFRDSAGGMPEEYEVAMMPFFITKAIFSKYGLDTPEAWSAVDERSKITALEGFMLEMSRWQRAFKWLPSDRPDGAYLRANPNWKYGNTLALMSEFYMGIFLRVGKSSAEEARLLATDNYEKSVKRLNRMRFMGKGNLTKKPNEKIVVKG